MGPTLPSHGLLHVPDEGADADGWIAQVEFPYALEEFIHLVVLYNGNHAGVHLGPCVGTAARLAAVGAAPLYLLKEGETPDIQFVKHILHPLGVRLIIYYHYTFHIVVVF